MENRITPEQIEKAKECKTVGELLNLAKENGIEMTEAEATNIFAMLNPENGGLADGELESVAAGGRCDELKSDLINSDLINRDLNNRDHTIRSCDFDSWFGRSNNK